MGHTELNILQRYQSQLRQLVCIRLKLEISNISKKYQQCKRQSTEHTMFIFVNETCKSFETSTSQPTIFANYLSSLQAHSGDTHVFTLFNLIKIYTTWKYLHSHFSFSFDGIFSKSFTMLGNYCNNYRKIHNSLFIESRLFFVFIQTLVCHAAGWNFFNWNTKLALGFLEKSCSVYQRVEKKMWQ